jgi:hypothetical protein
MARDATRVKYANSFERFVITLQEDGVESASPGFVGGLTPSRKIFYDEIVTVYRYRVTDWNALTIMLLLALVFGLTGLGFYASGLSPVIALLLWLCGLGLVGFFYHRGFVRKKGIVRINSVNDTMEFPCNNDQFFSHLLSHLKIITASPPSGGESPA